MTIIQKPSSGNTHSALIRGLKVLQLVSEAKHPLRFSDLRDAFPGIQDSTFTRLLQTLEIAGYVSRDGRKGYRAGEQLEKWLGGLQLRLGDPVHLFQQAVHEVVTRSNESACIAVLEEDRLAVVTSQTSPGAVSIIEPGETLHFESDHAGSLVVLAELGKPERKPLLRSPYSHIDNEKTFKDAFRNLKKHNQSYLDRSATRPGICRLAIPFQSGTIRGSIFLCLTEVRAKQDLESLSMILTEARDALREEL